MAGRNRQDSKGSSTRDDRSPRQSTSPDLRESDNTSGFRLVSGGDNANFSRRSNDGPQRKHLRFIPATRMNPYSPVGFQSQPDNRTMPENEPKPDRREDKSKIRLLLVSMFISLAVLILGGAVMGIFVFGENPEKDNPLPHIFVTDLKTNISANISVSKELYETSDSANITQPDRQSYQIKLKNKVKKRSTSDSPWQIIYQANGNEGTAIFHGPIAQCTSEGGYNVTWIKDNKVIGEASFTININNTFSTSGQIWRMNSMEKGFRCNRTTGCAKSRLDISRNRESSETPLNELPRTCTFSYNAEDGNMDTCSGMTNDSSIICKTFTEGLGNEDEDSSKILISECDNKPCKHGICQLSKEGMDYICNCSSGFYGRHCENETDECLSSPCRNGATCVDIINGYGCTCAPGYSGDNCDIDIDECSSDPCLNGATCVDEFNRYTCFCSAGYTDVNCETDIDECSSAPCLNGAVCVDEDGRYTCVCSDGYTDVNCGTDIDECSSDPCLNGATCVDRINGYTCDCSAGYTDVICGTDTDECSSDPCLNGATCVDEFNGYTCVCSAGYTDVNCETDIDECSSDPCLNGATCVDGNDGYTCDCAAGYTDVNCGTDIDECFSDPCLNGATCTDGINGYTCDCSAGYTDINCKTDTDECSSDPCLNGATCVDEFNGYTCVCSAGYTDVNCETDIDECSSDPCLNDATCVNGNNGYTCNCAAGYTDVNCETDINECSSDPCVNGATCVDENNGYTCNCAAGYTDVNCGTDIDECSSDPCLNGATCVDQVDRYTCKCSADHTGVRCEKVLPGGDCHHDDNCTEHAECKDGVCNCTNPYTPASIGRYCTYRCSQQCESSTVDSYSIFGDVCGNIFKRCVNQTQYIEYCNPDDVFDPDNGVCVCVPRATATWCNSNTPTAELENTCNKKCLNDTVTP